MAVGFGELQVESALGQPLRVQIALVGSEGNDVDSRCFKAKVMSLDGASLGFANANARSDGPQPAIVFSTAQTVNEPALTLEVQYDCASQSRRDYQILLDLPTASNIALPVVGARRPVAEPSLNDKRQSETAPHFLSETPASDNKADSKRRRRRDASQSKAAEQSIQPQLTIATQVQEKRSKKSPPRGTRSVLHVGSDDSDSLNGAEGMHLALSHSLFGAATESDATPVAQTQAIPANAEAPVAANTDGQVHPADAGLQELQAKIRVLEAETEELRKLNTKHLAALETARKSQDSNGSLLFLYFLLFVCVTAIAWLIWRTKQIQSKISEASWREIVPEHDPQGRHEQHYGRGDDDEDADEDEENSFLRYGEPAEVNNGAALKQSQDVLVADNLPGSAVDQRLPADLAKVEESNESDYKFFANVRSALPNAEEILDEIQQAEFWMDMQQPQRAIEILESNWGVEQPSSPLPWLYLFDLYRTVRNKEKYEELTVNFKRLFNGQVIPWDDGDALKLSRSLEEFPFLVKKIIQLWGTDESVPFLEGLLIDERDGRRRGFDLAAYREILFLTNIAYEIQAAKDFVEPSFKVPEWSMSK